MSVAERVVLPLFQYFLKLGVDPAMLLLGNGEWIGVAIGSRRFRSGRCAEKCLFKGVRNEASVYPTILYA